MLSTERLAHSLRPHQVRISLRKLARGLLKSVRGLTGSVFLRIDNRRRHLLNQVWTIAGRHLLVSARRFGDGERLSCVLVSSVIDDLRVDRLILLINLAASNLRGFALPILPHRVEGHALPGRVERTALDDDAAATADVARDLRR